MSKKDEGPAGHNPAFDKMKEGFEKATKGFHQSVAMHKENAEAVVASSKIASEAAQEIAAEITAYTRSAVESGMAATKALQGVKSLEDLLKVQAEVSKSAFESYFAYLKRITDITVTTAQKAAQPLEARVKAATEAATSSFKGQ